MDTWLIPHCETAAAAAAVATHGMAGHPSRIRAGGVFDLAEVTRVHVIRRREDFHLEQVGIDLLPGTVAVGINRNCSAGINSLK